MLSFELTVRVVVIQPTPSAPLLPIFSRVGDAPCEICKTKDPEGREHSHLQVFCSGEEEKARRQHARQCPPGSQPMPDLDDTNVRQWIHNRCSAIYTVNKHKCGHTCRKYWKRIRDRFPHAATLCRFGYPQNLVPESHFTA